MIRVGSRNAAGLMHFACFSAFSQKTHLVKSNIHSNTKTAYILLGENRKTNSLPIVSVPRLTSTRCFGSTS